MQQQLETAYFRWDGLESVDTTPVNGFLLNLKTNDGSLLDVSTVSPNFAAVNFGGEWNNATYLPNGLLGVSASVGAGSPVTGLIYSVNFASTAQDIFFVYAQYADSTINFASGENVILAGSPLIPEPASISLLILGGLFLARRRK